MMSDWLVSLLTNQKSRQRNDRCWSDPACAVSVPVSVPPQCPLDNTSAAGQREHACRLAEYLQRKTTLHVSGVETGLNSRPCSQKLVLLTRTMKLTSTCLYDVINWAKAIPGVASLHTLWAPAQRKRATMLYFANVFIYLFFYGRLILRPWLTEVRENFTRGRPWVSLEKLGLGFFPGHP